MRKTELDSKQIIQLIEKYQRGQPIKMICNEYNRGRNTIYRILRNNNISTHNKTPNKTLKNIPQEEIDQIIQLYQDGYNSTEIGLTFGTSHDFILSVLKKFSNEDTSRAKRIRKFHPNEEWFDNIDCEEKAYFLGFLYADGNTKKDGTRVTINLQEQDKDILSIFSNFIYGCDKLYFRKKQRETYQNQYCLEISSSKINQRLTKLGCVPAKSLILTFPEWLINEELQRHFIRGYFDGDGCITIIKSKYPQYSWDIMSTNNFCQSVNNILQKELNINFYINTPYQKRGNQITTRLSIGGNRQVLKLTDWLYKDANFYLERKYQKYLDLRKLCNRIDEKLAKSKRPNRITRLLLNK